MIVSFHTSLTGFFLDSVSSSLSIPYILVPIRVPSLPLFDGSSHMVSVEVPINLYGFNFCILLKTLISVSFTLPLPMQNFRVIYSQYKVRMSLLKGKSDHDTILSRSPRVPIFIKSKSRITICLWEFAFPFSLLLWNILMPPSLLTLYSVQLTLLSENFPDHSI